LRPDSCPFINVCFEAGTGCFKRLKKAVKRFMARFWKTRAEGANKFNYLKK